jgi:DTW domain-containing protein
LPRYRLAPTSPSRYRIRRAPSSSALSTVEATVAALRILEPETDGFDQLLNAFDAMVEGQLARVDSEISLRFKKRRNRTVKNIPLALLGDSKNIVVAYGEAPVGGRRYGRVAGPPIYWVAQRLGSDEKFSCAVAPSHPLDETFLGHLELTRDDFATAVSIDVARQRWAQFRRPNDVVMVFQPGTARLFSYLAENSESCLVLKSVDVKSNRSHSTLDDLIAANAIPVGPAQHRGRAGKRLANAIALVQYLNTLGSMTKGQT